MQEIGTPGEHPDRSRQKHGVRPSMVRSIRGLRPHDKAVRITADSQRASGSIKVIPTRVGGDQFRLGSWVLAAVQGPNGIDRTVDLAVLGALDERTSVGQLTAGAAMVALPFALWRDRQHGRERPLDLGTPGVSILIRHKEYPERFLAPTVVGYTCSGPSGQGFKQVGYDASAQRRAGRAIIRPRGSRSAQRAMPSSRSARIVWALTTLLPCGPCQLTSSSR